MSPSATSGRTGSTAACRITAAGAVRASACAAAGPSTRTGSASAAATATSAASIPAIPTWFTTRARTARWAGATSSPANRRPAFRPAARARAKPPYRFNWNTPFILSHHNPKIFYCGGNYVFRSLNKGDDLRVISPEITLTKRGSATALAESPRNADVLWAGTDDGALWVTRNGGRDWTNVAAKVGLPGPRWVATIEASRFAEGRAYVAFDGHRSDDDAAVRLRHRGLRPDLEILAGQPAGRLDTLSARRRTKSRSALSGKRVRCFRLARPRRLVDEVEQQPADRGRPSRSPSIPRRARSSRPRTGGACGSST